MRILFSVFFLFFVILFSFGQENPYPCVQINNDGNYVITRTINNLKELDNPDFKKELRSELIIQISSFIESSTTITSSNSLKNKKGKKNTNSQARVLAESILNNPLIRVCKIPGTNESFVTMSIGKTEYSKNVYSYFIKRLRTESNGLSSLLKLGNINNKRIYKEKIDYYKNSLAQLSSLIPLVSLNTDTQGIFDRFASDVYILENQYVVWRKNKQQKIKDRGQSVVDGIKNIFK